MAAPTKPEANKDGTLVNYGPSVRREVVPEMHPSGQFRWIVYTLKPVTDGNHPTDGIEATTEPAVWIPQGTFDEATADRKCRELSGM